MHLVAEMIDDDLYSHDYLYGVLRLRRILYENMSCTVLLEAVRVYPTVVELCNEKKNRFDDVDVMYPVE